MMYLLGFLVPILSIFLAVVMKYRKPAIVSTIFGTISALFVPVFMMWGLLVDDELNYCYQLKLTAIDTDNRNLTDICSPITMESMIGIFCYIGIAIGTFLHSKNSSNCFSSFLG